MQGYPNHNRINNVKQKWEVMIGGKVMIRGRKYTMKWRFYLRECEKRYYLRKRFNEEREV